jgi:hypothetical protein
MLIEPTWFAEHRLTWVLPSGERKPGRIAIGLPVVVEGARDEHKYRCHYLVEPFSPPQGYGLAKDTMEALYYALCAMGAELFARLEQGVRVVYEDQSGDPDRDTLFLLMILGPLIREPGNPRGVADPEGKLAKLEAILAEERRRGKS